jgi:thiosulfate reductase cytochrome b subunit
MAQVGVQSTPAEFAARQSGHAAWVRVCHWLMAFSLLTLFVSGYFILMVHPRLYWGEAGNDLMPALLELPVSNNHQPERLVRTETFADISGQPESAYRNFEQFNQNGWARSLHFLAGWILVTTALAYVIGGLVTGHVRKNLLPKIRELAPSVLWRDLVAHLRPQAATAGGPPYGLLQRLTYVLVVFVALPLMVITGLAMAPAVTAAFPFLLDLFGGYQSARTVHFFGFAAFVLFVFIHVGMVAATGFRRQLRAMIRGQ